MAQISVVTEPFDAHAALRGFTEAQPHAGACASFIGLCRGDGPQGAIEWLRLDHYPGFTEQEIKRAAETVAARHNLFDLLVIHRSGQIAPGDAIVLVAALSSHRAAAFSAVEQLMDYLKTDAPFWKQEKRADGVHWIEPTAEDRRRRAAHNT